MVRVLYANGTAAARIGEMAALGGVSKSTVKTDGLVDGPTGRRLSERCPGSYFWSTESRRNERLRAVVGGWGSFAKPR